MTNTPILKIPQVASNQNQKEVTINTGLAILEAASNDQLTVDMSAGDVTLSSDQFTKYMMFRCQGHTAEVNLNTYLTKRVFIVSNEGTDDVIVHAGSSPTGTVTVPAAKIVIMSSNGVDTIRGLSSGATNLTDLSDVDVTTSVPSDGDVLKWNDTDSKWEAGAFSASVFTGLTDVPNSYTGKADQIVRVKGDASGLEFYEATYPISGTFFGTPTATQAIFFYVFKDTVKVLTDLPNAQFTFLVAPTADTIIDIQKNFSSIGSVTIHSDGTFDVTFGSDVTFAPGDKLMMYAPASPDATASVFTATVEGIQQF